MWNDPKLQRTQLAILAHHGGDGDHARNQITASYARRHDAAFWDFWDRDMAIHHQSGDGILDCGAGIGQFVHDCALKYPDSPVWGFEAAPYMLQAQLEQSDNVRMCVVDCHAPPLDTLPENRLSMVMANMLIHELRQPVLLFKAIWYWLKPGGRLCVIDVVRQPLADYLAHRYADMSLVAADEANLDDAFQHFLEHNRYHPQDLVDLLQMTGFELVHQQDLRGGRQVRLVVQKPL